MYFLDEAAQIACGITLHAVSHHNPDILKRHATLVMPFVFFAMHEQKDMEKGENNFLVSYSFAWNLLLVFFFLCPYWLKCKVKQLAAFAVLCVAYEVSMGDMERKIQIQNLLSEMTITGEFYLAIPKIMPRE